jgi:hypothetical protein
VLLLFVGAAAVALSQTTGTLAVRDGAVAQRAHAPATSSRPLPPRVRQAQRFLAERGLAPGQLHGSPRMRGKTARATPQSSGTNPWQPVGPTAVISQNYGLVTGRISALALDPSDTTGNRLYLGATGGGVWFSQNANSANPSAVEFTPLTDDLAALSDVIPASISVGALTVQPGGTGVVLAGTGDPNDALDSYYGAGILRSTDSGQSWSLISATADTVPGSNQVFGFAGEGFAGFAWSTANPELVAAAVSQAYEATLVNAEIAQASYEGLYYSSDSGATWHLATISDGAGATVQGPESPFVLPDGNAATSVVWNPVRRLFLAAVRFHGYYQSADGMTWTRMAAQPGANLTAQLCPTNPGTVGSIACPIFRGTLAVNPQTGDTFAWTVDDNNQDQGLWQDQCAISNGACSNASITFSQQLNTAPLETNTLEGPVTIANGDYNLALAAVPFEQDTYVLAGANDLWKCSLAAGCVWRDTTNAFTCMSAMVGAYQHTLAWNAADPLEIFLGNDSGIWRSTDAIDETAAVCNPTDSSHFQNLNGGLGSLAEVVSLSTEGASRYTMLAGLGANGAAGVKSTALVADWPEVEGGEGGPVAIDYGDSSNWYVNNQAGVSIYLCAQSGPCTPTAFGVAPVINDADVDGDGLTMTTPAPFLVDPVDHNYLLIDTCRVWRGPADGVGWSTGNAISPILDGNLNNVSCEGDALIRAMAALSTSGGGEAIYVGMYGALDGGSTLAGHVFGAVLTPGSTTGPQWQDLTLNPVTNEVEPMNQFGLDISSIFVDPHDPTGNTVYVTVEGFFSIDEGVQQVYRSTDGGAHWADVTSNMLTVPANGVVVDPQDANTVYVATDAGVFSTRQIATCANGGSACWSVFGSGLPDSPVVALAASPLTSPAHLLTAGTYGRGIWQIPLWTAGVQLTTATVKPASLTFGSQKYGTISGAKSVTLWNTGSVALTVSITMIGGFTATDDCQSAGIAAGASCTIEVEFAPAATGTLSGEMVIAANVAGGQIAVPLSGTGIPAGTFTLSPASIDFGQVEVGTVSAPYEVTASNAGSAPVSVSGVKIILPFKLASNTCGSTIAAQNACQLKVEFVPAAPGAASGTLTMTDAAGTQTVSLSGSGAAKATDTLSASSLTLPATVVGQLSAAVDLVLTNSGDLPLTSIAAKVSGPFQQSNNCGTSLPGHASCAFAIRFAPTGTGNQTGALTVSDALRVQTVKLSGAGERQAAFAIAPAQITFAAQPVGVAGAAMTLTVSNTGGAPMAGVSLFAAGESAASFLVSATTCGATLASGRSCTAQLKFRPVDTGGNVATLAITSSTIGVAPVSVELSGVGLPPPELEVIPPVLEFSGVTVGGRSVAKPVTISNVGGAALKDMHLAISGDYSFSAGSCTASLPVNASCTAKVVFSPKASGELEGALTISSVSGAAIPATVSLEGAGVGPATIETNHSDLDFGSVPVGQASAAQTITVTDLGTAELKGLSLSVSGAFGLEKNSCGSTLAAGKSCSAQVVFLPGAAGAQTGMLTVSSTTQWAAPVQVALSGMGAGVVALSATPEALAFGSVQQGSSSRGLSLEIANPGSAAVEGLSLKTSGNFTLSNVTCGSTLAAGVRCSTLVVFSPASVGELTGTLVVSGTTPGLTPVMVALSGIGQAAGSLSFNTSNLVFGGTTVGHGSVPQLATVTNTSGAAAAGLAYKMTGDFGIEDNECGATLAAGASCTMDIVFTPAAVGNRTGTLTATSTTAGVGAAEIVLTGTGLPVAYLAAVPAQLTFPGTTLGATSALTVTLSNPGIAAAGGLKAQATGDFSARICAASLPAGGHCSVNVEFQPTGDAVRSGELTLTTTAAGASPVVIPLAGTGTAPASIALNPPALRFAGAVPGNTSAPQAIVVSNAGAAPMEAPKFTTAGDFRISLNTCSGTLAGGASCPVQVEFAPTAIGGRTGTLTATSATRGVQPATANLSGLGLTPAVIGVSPTAIAFSTVLRGQSSAPKAVTIRNAGGTAIASLNLSVSQQFVLTASTCRGALAAGASCTVEVYFKPAQQGAVTGGLVVTAASASIPAIVALSGTGGAAAAISITPDVIDFPTIGVGHASAPVVVAIANLGDTKPLSGLVLRIGAGFRLADGNCGSVLAPRASCTVSVAFVPASAGLQQANLNVMTAQAPKAFATLQGTGFDFMVNVKGGASQTVASGETANYDLSVAPLNGSEGTFSFQCGALPANAQCVFSPTSETVTSGATGFVNVQILTGAASSSRGRAPIVRPAFPVVAGILLLPFALHRRRRALLLVALLALLAGGVTSCLSASGGGANSNQPKNPPGATPPGTYSIPITALADGIKHDVTLTLGVD